MSHRPNEPLELEERHLKLLAIERRLIRIQAQLTRVLEQLEMMLGTVATGDLGDEQEPVKEPPRGDVL